MAVVDLPERYNVAADLLERNLAAGRAAKVPIHSATGDVTYGDLHKLVCGAARALLDLGVRREERVLIAGYDSPGWVAAFLGAIRIGAVPVPVNPLLQRSEDYDHFIEDSLARVVVVDANTEEKLAPAVARARHKPRVMRADQIAKGDEVEAAPTRRDDMAFWLYSSGSTGKPKAVVHLQHDIPYTCITYAEKVLGITEKDTTFSTTGLFHAYGFGNNLTFPYWVGASTVLHAGRHTPATVLDAIEKRKPTLFFSAPTLYWAQHEKSKRSILGEWFFTGDRYRVDKDGFYWYEGRSDDMIKVSGLWVSPIEIEAALLEHTAVAESAVVGVSVDGFTKIKAFVIAKPGAVEGDALVAELQEHCKSRLQRFQYPHLIEFVPELPKTVTGKIQRYKLREKEAAPA